MMALAGGDTSGMLGLDRVRETVDSDIESSSSLIVDPMLASECWIVERVGLVI